MRELRIGATTLAMRAVVRGLALAGDPVAAVLGRHALADPYPAYERIRARGTVSRHVVGLHLTADHAVSRAVLRDPRFGVEPAVEHGGAPWRYAPPAGDPLVHPMDESLLMLNPPRHTRLRRIAAPWFTPAALREHTGTIQSIVDGIVDELAGRDEFDLMTDFADRVPVAVVRALFGLPDLPDHRFRRWGQVLTGTLDGVRTLAERRAVHTTVTEMTAYFGAELDRRRHGSGTDVLSQLARAGVGEDVRPGDLVALAGLLLVAGFETTVNAIGSAGARLLADPVHRRAALDDPAVLSGAVEETLRLEPPVQLTLRKALTPVTVGGTHLDEGALLVVLLAAANRDPAVFADPARFDPGRDNVRDHLAFSAGIHYCVGAGLARMETEIALRTLFARLPGLAAAGPVTVKRTRAIRGFVHQPVHQPL